MKLSRIYLGALLVGALFLSAPSSAQVVTILNFGSVNDPNGTWLDPNGDPLPEGQNLPYTETIPGGLASDPAPVAFNGTSPNNINPFNVVVGADPDPLLGEVEAAVLNGGATLEWTNVTSWNSNALTGDAGANFFSGVVTLGPTTFTITTADPGDVVVVEAIGSFERDGLVSFGGTSGNPGVYVAGSSAWTLIGTATGTSTGTLEVANVPGGGTPEGNVGAFRITITPATGTPMKGDVDLSGAVNFLDIFPFIGVLSSQGSQAEADCDCNGVVNFLDIFPFISILAG